MHMEVIPHEKGQVSWLGRGWNPRAGPGGTGRGGAGAHRRGLTLVEQGRVLAQGPQGIEGTEPPQHGPQWGRHAGLVRVLVEPPHHRELQERQGQGMAVVHLKTEHNTGPPTPVSWQLGPRLQPAGGGGRNRWAHRPGWELQRTSPGRTMTPNEVVHGGGTA